MKNDFSNVPAFPFLQLFPTHLLVLIDKNGNSISIDFLEFLRCQKGQLSQDQKLIYLIVCESVQNDSIVFIYINCFYFYFYIKLKMTVSFMFYIPVAIYSQSYFIQEHDLVQNIRTMSSRAHRSVQSDSVRTSVKK